MLDRVAAMNNVKSFRFESDVFYAGIDEFGAGKSGRKNANRSSGSTPRAMHFARAARNCWQTVPV